ncbi:auxin-responsive protein SAUR50-like [Vigna unguiculata]|uniref:auxin-responsive protein SAUR50-like n=1 Tax=Vigna unguiculata TaxID=3917 RepID=UPI001016A1AF|nr:auxin-responsive protein SAUR50-like [Vigna unguiculata]
MASCMWLKSASGGGSGKKPPPRDVPPGHLAVMVGEEAKRRFVIRADYLNHPLLQKLLDQYEGYGFNKSGPLAIPCDEYLFQDIIQALREGSSSPHVPLKKLHFKDFVPLLQDNHHGRGSSSSSN